MTVTLSGCPEREAEGWLLERLDDDATDAAPPDDSDDSAVAAPSVGTYEEPTPEADGPVRTNGLRIGADEWTRSAGDGQCFVEDGDLGLRATAWGSLDDDPALSFSIDLDADGSAEGQISSDSMGWVAGGRDGTELTVLADASAQTITGSGLFYDFHTDGWAYGSFAFVCDG